jgi:hypothetical protein
MPGSSRQKEIRQDDRRAFWAGGMDASLCTREKKAAGEFLSDYMDAWCPATKLVEWKMRK